MKYAGHLRFTLRPGEQFSHVPAHLDILSGAARTASTLDGGAIDRTLSRYGDGARTQHVFHARTSFGRPGQHHANFDEREESLGLSRTFRVEIGDRAATADVVDSLRSLALIESAVEETLATAPLATLSATPPSKADIWQPHEQIHAREALALEAGDERVRTAAVDTGIIIGHPEFQGKCLAGYDTVDLGLGRINSTTRLIGDSRGFDYNPIDEVGHGCGVAGIIGARGWGVPGGVGGATLILPIRVLAAAVGDKSPKRVGIGCLTDIDSGIKVAVDLGAAILNLSLGTPESAVDAAGPRPHHAVIRYATNHGCILVAAAGNSGAEERFYPAALPEVIAVGSIDRYGRRSGFGTWGKHLTISAPGERITTTSLRGYQVNSGTSFASPFVAGVCALMASRAMRSRKALDGATAKRLLIESAASVNGGGFHPETGYGQLDALAALRRLDRWIGSGQ